MSFNEFLFFVKGMKVADGLYSNNWYKLPMKVQKRYQILIEVNQRPRNYSGFNMVTASKQSLKEVFFTKLQFLLSFINLFGFRLPNGL